MNVEAFSLYPTIIHRVRIPELNPYNDQLAEIAIQLAIEGSVSAGASGQTHHVGYQTKPTLFDRSEECFTKLKNYHSLALQEYLQTDIEFRRNFKNGRIPPFETVCWAYIQDEKQITSYVHHHGSSGVTALYYARAPGDLTGHQGCISFVDPRGAGITSLLGYPIPSETSFFKPEQGTMLLFPSWLQHRPMPMPSSKGWRVALGIDANFKYSLKSPPGSSS